jgi:hypothetical protein
MTTVPIVAITSGSTTDGPSASDAPPTSDRASRSGELLPTDLARIVRRLHDHPRDAGLWGEPAFAWEVDRVRRQLAPIVSRRALAASFAREAFRTAGAAVSTAAGQVVAPGSIGPVHCAYGVRWLELGDGAPRPGWSGFVTGGD